MTSVALDDPRQLRGFLSQHGFQTIEPLAVTELSGGISCRVLLVATRSGDVVVKQALPELRVAGHWVADVGRADVEAAYGQAVTDLVPGSCPHVLAVDPQVHAFVMAPAPQGSLPWKEQLMVGQVSTRTAHRVGEVLGTIHHRTATTVGLAEQFADRSHFRTLRLEPYFGDIARAHPDLASSIEECIHWLDGPGATLVHGDVSPKNILVAPDGEPLLIDHEVAHWGQPAFDTAFVVNHLCLKAIRRPPDADELIAAARSLLSAYAVTAEGRGATPQQTARVLAPLLLARVDGRSPVEYLDPTQQERTRQLARAAIAGDATIDQILDRCRTAALGDP